MLRLGRHPHAPRQSDYVAFDVEFMLFDAVTNALSHYLAIFEIGVNQHDDKFIAAIAKGVVTCARALLDDSRHFDKKFGADPVTTCIVDLFKEIEIHEKNAEAFFKPRHAIDFALKDHWK